MRTLNGEHVRSPARFPAARVAALAVMLLCGSRPAQAQASYTADRKAEVSAYVMGGYATTDYGDASNKSISLGADYTRFFRFPINPSLEIRFNVSNGPTVNENTFLAGIRGDHRYGRFTPYADFLIGAGNIYYNFNTGDPNYTKDNSIVSTFGAGVQYDLAYHLSAKFDFQYQSWNLGTPPGGNKQVLLNPTLTSIGVVYTFPFSDVHHDRKERRRKNAPAPVADSAPPAAANTIQAAPAATPDAAPSAPPVQENAAPATQPSSAPASPAPATNPPAQPQ